jgi:hypothetical protein
MKQKPRSPHKRQHPKTHLRLPDLEYSKTAVLNSLTSTDGQRGYGHAIDEFVDWYCSEPRLALINRQQLVLRSIDVEQLIDEDHSARLIWQLIGRLDLDLYHAQIVGGDLIRRFEHHLGVVGHVQVAAVPSRHEPDEGEVSYPAIFAALDRLGYRGFVGAEYRPRGKTEEGLGWARPYGVAPRAM